jgi:hypothetical protein
MNAAHLTALRVLVFVLTSMPVSPPGAYLHPPLFLLAFEMLGLGAPPLSARRLLGLFSLTVLWMNLHAEATVLPFYIVVLLLSEGLTRPFPRRRVVSLGLAAALTMGAVFVSPLGASACAELLGQRENSWEWFTLFDYQTILDRTLSAAPSDYPMFVHLLGHPFSLVVTITVALRIWPAWLSPQRRRRSARPTGQSVGPLPCLQHATQLVAPLHSHRVHPAHPLAQDWWRRGLRNPTQSVGGVQTSPPATLVQVAATASVLFVTAFAFEGVVRPVTWFRYDDDGWDARMFQRRPLPFWEVTGRGGGHLQPGRMGGYLVIRSQPPRLHARPLGGSPQTYADYQAILRNVPAADLPPRARPRRSPSGAPPFRAR